MKSSRCPEDFEPNEKSLQFCYQYGMTRKAIDKHLYEMKDHEYKQPKTDWDATFRNWIRTAIRYGHITPIEEHEHKTYQEELPEERKAAIIQFNRQMKRFGK